MLRCIRGHEEGQGDGDETTPIHSAVQSHVAPRGSLLVRTTIHGPGGIPACFWNKCRQSARFALFANAGVTPQALDRVSRMSSDMLAHRRDIVGFLQWAGEFVVLNAHDEEWCEDFDMDCFDSRLSDPLCRGVRFYPPRGFYDFFIACPEDVLHGCVHEIGYAVRSPAIGPCQPSQDGDSWRLLHSSADAPSVFSMATTSVSVSSMFQSPVAMSMMSGTKPVRMSRTIQPKPTNRVTCSVRS